MRKVLFPTLFAGFFALPVLAQINEAKPSPGDEETILAPIFVTEDRLEGDPGLALSIDKDTLNYLVADHPAETINSLPGVNVQINSGQEHLIALRSPVLTGGAGQGSFLILENGLPTRSSAFGNVNSLFEPVHELSDGIEVVVGPGSAKYGSNAVHGLLNFGLPDPASTKTQIDFGVSSLGRYKLNGLVSISDRGIIGVAVQHDNGWRDNTGVDQQKLYLARSFDILGWKGLAWATAANLNQETAGFIEGPDAFRDDDLVRSNPNPEAFRDAKSARAAVRLVKSTERVDWRVTPYARWQEMEFAQHFLPNGGLEENGHSAFGVQTRADWRATDAIVIRAGFDADFASGFLVETQLEPFGFFPGDTQFPVGVHYDYTVDTDVFALWGEADWQLTPQLRLQGGLRAETHRYDYTTNAPTGINGRFNVPEDSVDNFDLITPKLGAVYKITDSTELFFNYARGARAPQATDLYRLQSQQVAGEGEVETLDSFEIGARGQFGEQLTYQIAAYTADKNNFFFRDSDGLNVTNGTTRHTGIDALMRLTPIDALYLEGALSWSDQVYTFDRPANGIVDGNPIDTAPEWLADVAAGWHVGDRLNLRAEAEYIGEYFTDPANSRQYDGHIVFHVSAQYDLPNELQVYTRIRNIFDKKYADRADFAFGDERFFPGEPINITVGIRKSFGD